MRYLTALCAVVMSVGVVACGGGITLPPVAPEDVEIFYPGQLPSERYQVMARIQEDEPLQTDDDVMIDAARAQAARIGADALVITAIRRTTEGQIETDLGREQMKILEALAVYFPSRHPELENQ